MSGLLKRVWPRGGVMFACACALLGSSGVCRAQAPALTLDTKACAERWADELERFVQVELGASPAERPQRALEVNLRCAGELVAIEVTQPGAPHVARRSMDLSATAASVRGRVVALAIAGLARELALVARSTTEPRESGTDSGSGSESESGSGSESESESGSGSESESESGSGSDSGPRAADIEITDPDVLPTHALQVDLLLVAGSFAASGDLLWGGGVRVHYLALESWRVALDVQAGTYARDTPLGSARLVAGSLGARLGYTLALRGLALTPGAGQRVGVARASAEADDATTQAAAVTGVWTAPFVFVTLDGAVSGRFRLGVDLELGAVLAPVRGRVQRDDDVAAQGLWAAVSALIAAQF